MERFAHISKDFRTQTLDEHLEGTAQLRYCFSRVTSYVNQHRSPHFAIHVLILGIEFMDNGVGPMY